MLSPLSPFLLPPFSFLPAHTHMPKDFFGAKRELADGCRGDYHLEHIIISALARGRTVLIWHSYTSQDVASRLTAPKQQLRSVTDCCMTSPASECVKAYQLMGRLSVRSRAGATGLYRCPRNKMVTGPAFAQPHVPSQGEPSRAVPVPAPATSMEELNLLSLSALLPPT